MMRVSRSVNRSKTKGLIFVKIGTIGVLEESARMAWGSYDLMLILLDNFLKYLFNIVYNFLVRTSDATIIQDVNIEHVIIKKPWILYSGIWPYATTSIIGAIP